MCEELGTDRTPQQEQDNEMRLSKGAPVNQSLKRVNVSQVKIMVSKDMVEFDQRPKSVTPDLNHNKSKKLKSIVDLSDNEKNEFQIRSYTCVNLD